jgi:hypothetical protein
MSPGVAARGGRGDYGYNENRWPEDQIPLQQEVMMRIVIRWAASTAFVASVALLASAKDSTAQEPNFTGTWQLDAEKSDDMQQKIRAGAGKAGGITQPEIQRLLDRFTHLAHAADVIEIEQTKVDFKIFDRADNVRIYYMDGKKHPRQTPWGAKLQTVANWDNQRLLITTEGKDLGKVTEVYAFEGQQLIFIIQVENKKFENDVLIRHYYDRLDGQ